MALLTINNDDDDDEGTDAVLSPETLALVLNFMHDRDAATNVDDHVPPPFEDPVDETFTYQSYIERFKPQYSMSQFWYAETTARDIVSALDRICQPDTTIAFLCCPSGYAAYNARTDRPIRADQVFLLEYDTRFAKLAGQNYVYYDIDDPPDSPISQGGISLIKAIDIIVVDPPYHSAASQKKIAHFIPCIARRPSVKIFILTGMALSEEINGIYKPALNKLKSSKNSTSTASLHLMNFEVKHDGSGSQLQNQYGCWTNATNLLQSTAS